MNSDRRFLIFVLIVTLFIGAICLYIYKSSTADYRQQYIEHMIEYQIRIAKLEDQLKAARSKVDTHYVEIERIIHVRDTIIKEIELMEPDQLVHEFDMRTGDHEETRILDSRALVPMPRIRESVVIFTMHEALIKEAIALRNIIELKDEEIALLEEIIKEKDGYIDMQDERVSDLISRLQKEGLLRKILTGLALVLGVAAIF